MQGATPTFWKTKATAAQLKFAALIESDVLAKNGGNMIELDGDGSFETPKSETVLNALNDARVFAVKAVKDGRFRFRERCDDYYRAILTKEQVLLLADELRALANTV